MHHNKFEPECKADRNLIVNVVGKYKFLLKKIVEKLRKDGRKNVDKLEDNEKYQKLMKKFVEIKDELVDPEYFAFVVGEKLVLDDE